MASKRKQIRNPFVRFIGTEARLGGAGQAQGPYMNRISGSAHARAVNLRPGQAVDIADFQAFGGLNGAIKALIKGQGSVTFARSTEASVRTEPDGLIDTAEAGEIRFENGRRVHNLFEGSTEDLTVGAWNAGQGATIDGPQELTFSANALSLVLQTRAVPGRQMTISAMVKCSSGTEQFRLRLGTTANVSPNLTCNTEWKRYSFTAEADGTSSSIMNASDAQSRTLQAKEFQVEFVDAQANQNPSEYVSVGVASAPEYHGVNVDGVRYYARTNPNRVGSNNEVISDVATTPLDDFRALFEPGVTSYINEPADFTLGANWVATGFAGTSQSSLDSSLKGFKLWRLEETTGSTGTRGITSNVHTKAAAAEVWHAEIIARPDQIGWIKLGIENSAETSYVFQFFNLNTGAVGGNLALNWGHIRGESEQLANGDWRFRVFGVTNNETSIRLRCNLAETDNDDFFNVPAGDGCYIQAANLKQEDVASSFVYSTGGSGSRSADVPSPMFDFANFSQTEGTWYMDVWLPRFQSEVIGLFSVANNESNVIFKGGTANFRSSDDGGATSSSVAITSPTAYNRYRPVTQFSQSDTLDVGYRDIDGAGSFAWTPAPQNYDGAFNTNNVMNICYDLAVPVRIRDFQGFTTRKGRTWVENNL